DAGPEPHETKDRQQRPVARPGKVPVRKLDRLADPGKGRPELALVVDEVTEPGAAHVPNARTRREGQTALHADAERDDRVLTGPHVFGKPFAVENLATQEQVARRAVQHAKPAP